MGDRDGDWIVYESDGSDAMRVAWTFETDRVDAGDRFAKGDLDGDGVEEFVTYTTFYPLPIDDSNNLEPAISDYYLWDSTGDDGYEPVARVPIAGETLGGALQTADLDDDGQDEVIVSHPPSLYVLDDDPTHGWQVVYHDDGNGTPIQSRSVVAEDVDGNGTPEILAVAASETLVRYDVNTQAVAVSPPRWTTARPLGATSVRLAWRAPNADSVQVFAGRPDADLDRIAGRIDSSRVRTTTQTQRYALRAWRNGTPSPLSETRLIRPHAPATVAETTIPDAQRVRLTFTEPLHPQTQPEQFVLNTQLNRQSPDALLPDATGRTIVLRFADPLTTGTLRWSAVRDADGLPVAQTEVAITPPDAVNATLFVETATVLDPETVRLTFSAPLQPSPAQDPGNYTLAPRGRVTDAQLDDDAQTVTLTVADVVIGATGRQTSLTVTTMTAADGATLDDAGRSVSLTQPASDLANVFVYPNPYRAREHGDRITVAGLPLEATIRIYTPDGRLVRVLETRDNTRGGATWDLRDRRGQTVPSGVYLFRVESPAEGAVLRKAAILR